MNTPLALVVDTNIVFSAVIKPSKIRDLLFTAQLSLYAPEELVGELEELQARILQHTRLTPAEVILVKNTILERIITIVPRSVYREKTRRIYPLLERTDPEDTPFIALAMHLGVPLWTGDRGLIRLAVETGFRYFTAIDTEGVEILLEGAPLEEARERMKRKYRARI